MPVFNIKDIMITDVVTVKKDTPIQEVLEILVRKNITGLPVVDDGHKLLGIVTEKDILRLLGDPRRDPGRTEDYMSTEVVSFDVNDDLIAVCECLVHGRFRRVPITSRGRLAGIISRRDIIKYILEPIG